MMNLLMCKQYNWITWIHGKSYLQGELKYYYQYRICSLNFSYVTFRLHYISLIH